MAELYESPKQYVTAGGQSGTASNAQPSIESIIDSLPPEEREEALKYITAPPTGEEIARAMAEKNANGELMDMSLDQYRLFKAYQKNKEVDVISTIGEAASTVFDDITKAAGSVYDKPIDSLKQLTPSVIEAFVQGTRNLYGMAAQSADPTSVFFRMKNALQANGDDEAAEYQQFMEAQAFNLHSMRLMTGQDTIVMDKDVINPEMTQLMSYVADPTLFVPFGGIMAKGASLVGMGEKLAAASARTAAIKRGIMGGALKWGVGAPIEFMGTAVRNTIDYGLERGSKAFETVTGMPAAEVRTTAQMYGWTSASAAMTGASVPLPVVGDVAGAMVGSTTARGVGEAIGVLGEQMMKQRNTGRGVLGYAGQALRDTKKNGVVLSKHAEKLLGIIEAVDPLFVYADEITSGAMQGAAIGGGLGYLAGGEEGMAGGIGSGMALGAVGAGAGKITSDITGNTKMEQIAIQRKLVVEGLKELGHENAVAFEAMALAAEATGDRTFQAQIDGIIAGIDVVNPDVVVKAFNESQYKSSLESVGIDPNTGKLREKSSIFPEIGDRRTIADVVGILRDNGGNFAGDPKGFEKAITTEARYKKLKPIWERLDDNAKAVLLKQIQNNANPEFVKSLKGRPLNAHFGDLAYAERLTEMINTLNEKNANLVAGKISEILKAETRSDKKLTRRGQMLKEKLQADGYIDKDGTIRKSRNMDVEETLETFGVSAGWTKRRNSTGQTEIIINLDKFMQKGNRESMPHELFHSIMRDSVFAKDYSDRLIQKLVGTFDPKTGKMLEKAVVEPAQLKKFMQNYINSVHRNQSEEFRTRKMKELDVAMDEYKKRVDQNRIADGTPTQLESLIEEFGAYYFAKFVMDKPVDFLFRGGEYSGLRALFETSKESFLDFWRSKIAKNNPSLNFDNIEGFAISRGFGKDGRRAKVTALDLFMQDMVRMQANINRGGRFDVSNLSADARKQFIQTHGLRGQGFETIDKAGNLRKPKLRRYTAEEIRQGKEMFKVLDSLSDADHRGGMRRDGDGNWSGRPNTAQMNALIGTGYLQRAWFDRLNFAYNIIDGKGSNVVEFGYLGYSAHIGDGNERVYGAAVPFKNRRAILLDVDFKVRADGTTFANFHTLDLKVIEARGNEVWRDPQVRDLWKGDRTSMEADFYAYLSNASLPSGDPNRKPSFRLLDRGDGLGGQRRDALHQMLGFHKGSDLPYINKPIAEIPVGIRHSVTTFSNDGIVAMRTAGNERVNYNHANAHLDLTRNFMPSEMTEEKTPSGGKVIKHATGYKISKQAGEKFKVFDPEGKMLGQFDTVADAGRAAQKHFNDTFDKSVEGKDAPVPPTEVPPSRQAYIDREFTKELSQEKLDEIKDMLIRRLEERIEVGDYRLGTDESVYRADISKLIDEGLTHKNIKYFAEHEIEVKEKTGLKRNLLQSVETYVNFSELENNAGNKYDNMYPMEIKSALYPRLAQIFQDYPNLTAQGLLKKLVVYGSQGSRMFQEATEIGLVDLLKSKIQKTTTPRFLEDGRMIEMAQGETQPKLDMKEILDFAKEKEIKVTIEEDAREVNGLDTSQFTLGGTKDNYKQTAIRINPEYAHGIRGHYGEDTIVHFRTTERIDAEGNRHLFVEEVQANNTDKKGGLNEADRRKLKRDEASLPVLQKVFQEGKDRGLFTKYDNLGYEQDGYQSSVRVFFQSVEQKQQDGELRKIFLENKEVLKRFLGDSDIDTAGLVIESHFYRALDDHYRHILNNADLIKKWERENIEFQGFESKKNFVEQNNVLIEEARQKILNSEKELVGSFENVILGDRTPPANSKIPAMTDAILSIPELKEYFTTAKELAVKVSDFQEFLTNSRTNEIAGLATYAMNPHHLEATISDIKTRIQQAKAVVKPLPLTSAKDWTLTALKGIIRQAIRDGLDRITLTHPDDSPTTSHMAGDARRPLYGKLIPEIWGSWLRKYGIEIAQSNKLTDTNIAKAKNNVAQVSNRISEANKKVLERFEKVGAGENPEVINSLAKILATPVHEYDGDLIKYSSLAGKVNDVELSEGIKDILLLKQTELHNYKEVLRLQEESIPKQHGISASESSSNDAVNARISAEALDRGMTFELNDRIKRDFIEGKIQTHMMPSEGGAEGGRTYDQQGRQWKFGFIGRVSEENPELTKGVSLQHIDKANGVNKLVFTDTSSGESKNIGHITWDKYGGISTNIDPQYRGKGLSYLFYSEAAERMRAQGIKQSVSTIVNKEAIPVKVREAIFGDTRRFVSRSEQGKPISQAEAKAIIAAMQEQGGEYAGVTVSNKIDPNARYMPSEGGRIYNDKQMSGEFIGRYASENPKATKGLKPKFNIFSSGDQGNIELMKGQDSIGYINFSFSKATGDALIEYTNVARGQQGKGYGNLLYSELVERLRSMGMKEVQGMIIDDRGRPQKIRERIIDRENARIGGEKTQIDYVEKDPDSDATQTGVTSYLYNKAWYMPAEGVNAPVDEANRKFILDTITGNDNSRRALEEGMKPAKDRKQNYITIDNINPEQHRGTAVVMHSPDNAGVEPVKIGRFTVNPRGGVRYPIEYPTEGWAGVKAGLGKQVNENGDKNAADGKGWWSSVGLIKGENAKMKGTHIGLEVFLRNLQNFTDNGVLTESQTKQILKKGLGDIGDIKRPLDAIVEDILVKSSKHEGRYTIEGRRKAVESMTKTDGHASLWKYLQSDLTKLEPLVEGFSSQGVTNANQFIKAILEPMYEAVSDPLTRHAKVGEVYGYLVFRSPVQEPEAGFHPSYKYSVAPEKGGQPVQLDLLSKPVDARKAFTNRITAGEVSALPQSEKGFQVSTGQKHIPTMRGTFMPAEVHGITPTEGFKWFKRNKFRSIPNEREKVIDNILNDVLENGLSYNEAAQKNNDSFKNVFRIVSNYVEENPSALKLTPAERVKSYDYKWFVPLDRDAKTRLPLSKAIKIDNALDDIANKRLDIQTASTRYQIPRQTLEAYINAARKSEKGFPYFLSGINTTKRDAEPYVFNEGTRRFKVSEENKKLMLSMYEDEGMSVTNEIAPQFGLSPNMVYKFIKEQKDIRDNKPSMQPAEGWRDWKSESTSIGSVVKNAVGYVIMVQGNKFKVYNPYKSLVGIYNDLEQAKRRVQRDEPKQ